MFLFVNQEKGQPLLLEWFMKSIPSCPPSLETDTPNKCYWQGQQPASGCYRQDFSKSNKHCFGHAGERQHAHQQKTSSLSPTSFCSITSRSVYSSSQPFVLVSNSLVLCLPFLYGREPVYKTHHNPNTWKNTFRSMNGNQNQGYF